MAIEFSPLAATNFPTGRLSQNLGVGERVPVFGAVFCPVVITE
jgi:hypothetical protein